MIILKIICQGEGVQKISEAQDQARRAFLIRLVKIFSAVSVAGIAWPFVKSMFPSKIALSLSGPVEVDVSKLKIGEQLTVMWQGKPVWIIKRDLKAVDKLNSLNNLLRDPFSKIPQQPKYAANINRSIRKDILVLVAACTHLGCAPTYRPDKNTLEPNWPGGFFCSCHGSKFDLAGRVYKGVPAPTNLEVPPYYFVNDNTIVIGKHLENA
jgi:ubiquinol-cytochrome c reductase iron-sulfur subunit